jgi:peptidoglycan/LPS O-acetylase OafA/YrhL
VLSSLTYVTNWWLIADHQSYFVSSGRPTMLQHLWSLAIEEQFYIVWSVVVIVIAVIVLGGRNAPDSATRVRWVVVAAAALATASAMAMSIFAEQQDLPYGGSTSRVYFGSDTHTTGLFLGAAAGAWLALRHRARNPARLGRRYAKRLWLSDGIGAGALVVLVYEFFAVNEFSPGLYRGGFLAFDVVVLVAILAATRAGSIFGRVLDMRPLRWLGKRSYAIYIWHWPVCVVTRPDVDVHGSTILINLARLALILALSTLSYRFIEVPLRIGRRGTWRPDRNRRAEIVAVLITLGTAGGLALAANPVSAAPTLPLSGSAPAHSRAPTHSQPPGPHHAQEPSPPSPHPKVNHGKHQKQPKAPLRPSLSAYGDSVLLGAGPRLSPHLRHLDLDAVEGRQAYDVLNDIIADARHHQTRPYVLIHIGDNGIISPPQLDYALHELRAAKRVVLMTVRVPREWQDPNNNTIRSVGHHYANVDIVDWHALASAHPQWVYSDGIHLTAAGAVAYTHIVMTALR